MIDNDEKPDAVVEFLGLLHDKCLDLSRRIVFDKTHALHFGLMSLYGSLIELVGCIITLMTNRGKLGVPTLFRTLLETYVELSNLVRDPKYGYIMEANDLKQELKMLKASKEKATPFLASIAILPNLGEIIEQKEKQLAELKEKGYKPIHIFKRFELADMQDEYISVYNMISAEAHSSKRALISRHADISADGADYVMTFYKNAPDKRYRMYTDSAAGLLVDATLKIHDHFKSDVIAEARALKGQLEDLRKQYLKITTNDHT